MAIQFIVTGDGSHTLLVPEMGEHYHSIHGAIQESLHIFIQHGYSTIHSRNVSILEVGFGTGLNAFLTLLELINKNRSAYYETWEACPLTLEEANQLNYPDILATGRELFTGLHEADWDREVVVNSHLSLKKVRGDIRQFNSLRMFDLVYFDAFGPDFQPELWTDGVFNRIGAQMKKDSRLVTYSAKGQVRRSLKDAGFSVQKAPGPPGKREITIAIKL